MIIARYLTREVLHHLLVVTFLLMLIFLSQQIVRYLNFVATGKVAANILMQLIGFESISLFTILLPLGLYLGIILAFSRLYAENEMIILLMSGFSARRLIQHVTLIGLIVMLILLVFSLWIKPMIVDQRQALLRSDQMTVHLVRTLVPGRFQVSPDGQRVIYTEKLSRDHQRADNIFLAQQKPSLSPLAQPIWTVVLANEGYEAKDEKTGDPLFVIVDGNRYEGIPGQNDYRVTQFKKYKIHIFPVELTSSHQEDEAMPVSTLWQQYDTPNRAAELQFRLSIPLSALILGLLAIPLSVVKPRKSRYVMLIPAILIYIVYTNLLFISRRWIEQQTISINLGMWWVHALMLLLVIILLSHYVRQWKSV